MRIESYLKLLTLAFGVDGDSVASITVQLRKDGAARKLWVGFWVANPDSGYFVWNGTLALQWLRESGEVLQQVDLWASPENGTMSFPAGKAIMVAPVTSNDGPFSLAPFSPDIPARHPDSVLVTWCDALPSEVFDVRPWPSVPPTEAAAARLVWNLQFTGAMTVTSMPLRAVLIAG